MSLVAVGDPVRLTIMLENVKESEVKVVFYRVDNGVTIGEVTRPVAGDRLSVIWPAEGPNADAERSCEVTHRVVVGKVVQESTETFVVFHDWVEVECVDASDAAASNVSVRLKRGNAGPQTIRTGSDGKGRVSVSTPDPYELDVMPPYRLVAWEGSKTGAKHKAKVEPCPFEVKFKWPVPGDAPHRQYVNHDTFAAPQGLSREITLQIERKAGEINNTEFFIKAEFGAGNLERSNGKKYVEQPSGSPLKEESAGGATLVGKKVLKSKDDVAEIKLALSAGGGDKVTIKIGDNKDCLNDTLVIETWRLINYCTPPGQDLPANIVQKVASMFAPAFIEPRRKGDVRRQLNTACCHTIKGNYYSNYYRNLDQRNVNEDYLILDFTPDDAKSPEYNALSDLALALAGTTTSFTNPDIAVYSIDGLFKEQRCTTVVEFELKNKEATRTIEASKGYRFLEKRIADGKPFFKTKCTITLRSGTFTPAFDATISDDAQLVTFALAPEEKQPGGIGDLFGTVRSLRVQLDMYETKLFSGLAPNKRSVFIQRRPHMENTWALTIAHEFAHAINEVADKTTNSDLKAADHPHFVLDRGFNGKHCTHGVAASHLGAQNYLADLHDKKIRGDCVMWGAAPRGVAEDAGAPTTFCEACLTNMKINSMGSS